MWRQANLLEQIDHCDERPVDQACTGTFVDRHIRNKRYFSLKDGLLEEQQHGPSSPRRAGSESSSHSMVPNAGRLVIAGRKQRLGTSSSGRKSSEVIGTVRAIYSIYYQLCRNICVKAVYAAYGWVIAISESFSISPTHAENLF